MSKWNGNRFSVYTSEEKSVLGLIKEMGDQTNYNSDEIERLTQSDNKKVSHQEMQDIYKIDKQANFTGSWFGIKKPTQSSEGLAATVDQLIDETIPGINSQLEQSKQELSARMDTFTTLEQGSTSGDAELLDGRISFKGVIYNNIGEAIREENKKLNEYLSLNEILESTNLINTNSLLGKKISSILKLNSSDSRYYSDYIQITPLTDIGNGVGLKCIVDFIDNTLSNYNGFNIEYYNNLKERITYFQVWNPVTSSYPVTGAKFIRIVANDTVYSTIKDYLIKNFTLGFNITTGSLFKTILKGKVGNDFEKNINYINVLRSICRLGYDVYNSSTPPQQSIKSYKLAYEKGFRILLCDLRFTSDNVPVLHHDSTINTYALNNDGTTISETVTISNTTYANLLNYDYGLYKGQEYKGTKIMHLKDMLKLCRNLGTELYIEVKAMSEEQCKIACDLVKFYKMEEKTSWSGTTPQMQYVISNIDIARVSTMPQTIQDSTIQGLNVLKTGKNKVFFFAWDTTVLTTDLVNKLIANNIDFEMGTLDSETDIINYFSRDDIYYYCSGISSNKLVAGKVMLENQLIN